MANIAILCIFPQNYIKLLLSGGEKLSTVISIKIEMVKESTAGFTYIVALGCTNKIVGKKKSEFLEVVLTQRVLSRSN